MLYFLSLSTFLSTLLPTSLFIFLATFPSILLPLFPSLFSTFPFILFLLHALLNIPLLSKDSLKIVNLFYMTMIFAE